MVFKTKQQQRKRFLACACLCVFEFGAINRQTPLSGFISRGDFTLTLLLFAVDSMASSKKKRVLDIEESNLDDEALGRPSDEEEDATDESENEFMDQVNTDAIVHQKSVDSFISALDKARSQWLVDSTGKLRTPYRRTYASKWMISDVLIQIQSLRNIQYHDVASTR